MEFTSNARSFGGFVPAFFSPFSALSMIMNGKGMKRYLIIPFILNAVILILLLILAFHFLYPFIFSFIPQGDVWYFSLLRFLVKPLLVFFLLVFVMLLYSITGMIATAPFIDPLSERIEQIITGKDMDIPFSIVRLWNEIARACSSAFRLVSFIIMFNIVILFLNIIPVIGTVLYTAAGFLSLLYFLGFQMFDITMQRKGYSFGEKFRMMWTIKWAVIGMGLGFLVVSYIPLVGFLAPCAGSAGATKFFCENTAAEISHAS